MGREVRRNRIAQTLQRQYREHAAAGDWHRCLELARLIGTTLDTKATRIPPGRHDPKRA